MAAKAPSMQASVIENIGRPRALKTLRMPLPQPGPGEALVKIHAASVSATDLLYRSGQLVIRKPLPHILGSDLAGEIERVAPDVEDWSAGDRVAATFEELGSERDGSYAEYCVIPADRLVKLPGSLSFQAAAAAGVAFARAWLALIETGKLKESDRVVIRGASSGVGMAAMQIARGQGAQVIAISPGQYAAQLREIGADIVLEDRGSDLVRQVKVATEELGASLVLHSAGEERLEASLRMLAAGGRCVIAAAIPGCDSQLDMMDVCMRNLSVRGACRSINARDFAAILDKVDLGVYAPPIDETMPLSRARQAHQKMERGDALGSIILSPDAILAEAKKPESWIPIK